MKIRLPLNRAILGALVVIFFCQGCSDAFAAETSDSQASLRAFRDAWRRRAKKFHSARFVYSIRHLSGVTVDEQFRAYLAEKAGKVERPTGRLVYDRFVQLSIDGVRMRYELLTGSPIGKNKDGRQVHLFVYDGQLSKGFFPPSELSEVKHPTGHITNEQRCAAAVQLDNHPLRWHYAMLKPEISEVDIEKLRLSSREGVIGERKCIILETTTNSALPPLPPGYYRDPGLYSYWADPEKDYLILRYTWGQAGRVATQIDVSYKSDAKGGWAPWRWKQYRLNPDGTPKTAEEVQVIEYEVNPRFRPDEFQFTFPVGTVVADSRPEVAKGRRLGVFLYLVREGGEKREITWAERFASYEDLLRTESGTAHLVGSRQVPWFWITNVVIIVLVASLLFVRHRYKTR